MALPVCASVCKCMCTVMCIRLHPDEHVGTFHGSLCHKCMNVFEWVNVACSVKCFEWSEDYEGAI